MRFCFASGQLTAPGEGAPVTLQTDLRGLMVKTHNRTGRNRYDAAHVRLHLYMLNSPAYLSLSTQARAALIEIARRYNGSNNGFIGASVRSLAERCRIAPGTACKALGELQASGFIECVTPGGFTRKTRHASEWRLTWVSCNLTNALPQKPFMRWQPEKQNSVSNHSLTVSNEGHSIRSISPKSASQYQTRVP